MKRFLLVLFVALLFPAAASADRSAPSWGMDRIDQENLPLDGRYKGAGDGSGTRIYVVGSGVAALSEFGARLQSGYGDPGDCRGTGTAAASVAAGASYGIATDAQIYPVRIRSCDGVLGDTTLALEWIRTNHPAGVKGVVLMTEAVPLSFLINEKAAELVAAGLPVVAAAGDENWDACASSPAYGDAALVVGSTGAGDARSPTSNRGSCLDLWAPGQGITSVGNTGLPITSSGTSLAAAHVAGVAALLQERGLPGSVIRNQILSSALVDKISDSQSTVDDLLFLGDLREGEIVRYGAPAISSPPSEVTTPTATWSFSGGLYSDGTQSGTWLHNILWDGESFDAEVRCIIRNGSGEIVRNVRVAGEGDAEPVSCQIDLTGLDDGSYQFAVRKDLVSATRRFPGAEGRAGLVVDLAGPEARWIGDPAPLRSSGSPIVYQLQVIDHGAVSGIAASDFLETGTAGGCTFIPGVSLLPAGGGTTSVQVTCTEDGTLLPEVRAGAFQSGGRSGPAVNIQGPGSFFDRQAPNTSWTRTPPASVTASSQQFFFAADEAATFECSLQYGEWKSCTSPVTISNLKPGSYNIRVRARDLAGNTEGTPLSHSWVVADIPLERPVNDNFLQALDLQNFQQGTNKNATKQNGEPDHGAGAWKSVWYRWTAPGNGDLDLWTEGSRLDTALAAYKGTELSSLRRLETNDDWKGDTWSLISVPVSKGDQLRIALAGAWGEEAAFQLRSRFYLYGKEPPRSRILSLQKSGNSVQLQLGTRGLGAPHSFQCLRKKGWKNCSSTPVWSGLRRGQVYTISVRTVSSEGLPESTPSRIRFRF